MKKAGGKRHDTKRSKRLITERAPDPPAIEEVVYVDDETFNRIQEWRRDPRYGEISYEAVLPGGDPEEFDAVVLPDAVDRELDQPVVYEVELRPRASGRGFMRVKVPLRQSPAYQEHLRRLSELLERGYGEVLGELERVVSPRKGRSLPPDARYFWYDWRVFRPRYVRRFTQQTTAWLRSPPGRLHGLAEHGERAIIKLTTRGRDRPRGRQPLNEPFNIDSSTLVQLREAVPALRLEIHSARRLARYGGGADATKALAALIRREIGWSVETCLERALPWLRKNRKPQYVLNQLLGWKHNLKPAKVQSLIAGIR